MQRTQVPCVLECRGAKFSGQVQYPLDAAQKRSIQAAQQNTQQHPAYLGRITLPQSPPSLDCCVQARFHWVWFYSQRVVYKDTVHVALPALAQHSPRRGRRSDDRQRTLAPQSPGRVRDRRLPTRLYAPSAYAPSNPCYQHTQCASGYPWLTHCNTPFKNALASIQRSFELFVAHKLTAFAHNSIMEALSRRENSRALTVWSQNVAGWMGF